MATVFERKNARNCFESTLSWEPDLTVRGACCGTAWPLGGASSSVGPTIPRGEDPQSVDTAPVSWEGVNCSLFISLFCFKLFGYHCQEKLVDFLGDFFGPHQIPPLVVEFR